MASINKVLMKVLLLNGVAFNKKLDLATSEALQMMILCPQDLKKTLITTQQQMWCTKSS